MPDALHGRCVVTVLTPRAQELADTYTANELAMMLAKSEELIAVIGERTTLVREQRDRLRGVLGSIARREWTRDGAVKVAQEALDA
jgi:hypothetical protein